MDNSSRNIVKFIGAITFAALLIMAARFYSRLQEEPMPAVAEDVAKAEPAPAEISDDPLADEDNPDDAQATPQNPEQEIIEEDAELIMGEPSMNLENGGTTIYLPETPAQAETQTPIER